VDIESEKDKEVAAREMKEANLKELKSHSLLNNPHHTPHWMNQG
jgi:hypothetical protein